jgi:hypothetical protein
MCLARRARLPLLTGTVICVAACQTSAQQSFDAGLLDDAGASDAGAFACTVQAPTVCPDPPPHYPDVQPLFQRACVPCHQGLPGGPWPLLQYSHIADWQDVVRAMLLDCSMPPPDAGVPMSDEERAAILTWILCGYLE